MKQKTNEFDNEFVEPADPNFEQTIYDQLTFNRQINSEHKFFLELVRGHPKQKPMWFVLPSPIPDANDTMQLIEITVKRLK